MLDVLYRIGGYLQAPSEPRDIAAKIYKLISRVIPCELFAVALQQPRSDELDFVFIAAAGKKPSRALRMSAPPLMRDAIMKKKLVVKNRLEGSANTIRRYVNQNGFARPAGSLIVSPILCSGSAVGVLCVESRRNAFSPEICKWLAIICSQLGGVFGQTFDYSQNGNSASAALSECRQLLETARKIGHEMNQPLTGISGYCTLVMEGCNESDPIYRDLQQIQQQAQRLEHLIFELQSLSRTISPQESKTSTE
jgi:hypothetical protein